MSVADLYDLELVWPFLGPRDVIVTGTFDQWSSSIHLVKSEAGFFGTVKVPWGQKVAYKFIVDGQWRYRNDRPQEDDGDGNTNNVFQTPERPEHTVAAYDPPARLSIPQLDSAPSEGYGDVENMVTAVEYFPSADPAVIRGSPPPPIPQISVEGLDPSPLNEFKLNTAAATEGGISPASATRPAEVSPSKQRSASRDVSVLRLSDDGSLPLPPISGNGGAGDGLGTHAPIQFSKGDLSASRSVPEATVESAVPNDSADMKSPLAVVEPTANEVGPVPIEAATQGPQASTPASIGLTSSPSTPTASTLTHKKRRSFFSRIKHIFDKNKDKQEKNRKE